MIHEFKKTHEIIDIKDLICDFFTESDCNCAGQSVKIVFVFQVIKETLSVVQVQLERRGLLEITGLQVMIQFWFCSRTESLVKREDKLISSLSVIIQTVK